MSNSSISDRQISITRDFTYPRALVFRAWTEQKHIDAWWGPSGFRNTTHEMNVQAGGLWRFDMHAPDGTVYPNKVAFIEVLEPERLIFMLGGDGDREAEDAAFHVTVTFEEVGGNTRLTMRMLFASVEACERVKSFGAIEGNKQTMDRLEQYLVSMS